MVCRDGGGAMLGWGMAQALPVFAAEAAPTGIVLGIGDALYLWERPCAAKGLQSSPGDRCSATENQGAALRPDRDARPHLQQ